MSIFMAITVMFQKGYNLFSESLATQAIIFEMLTSFESGKFTMC